MSKKHTQTVPVAAGRSHGREVLFSVTLKDCDLQTFAAGGKGGQHQNTANTGVRITHRASGAVGEARDNRSQTANKRAAWQRMCATARFRVWLNREIWIRNGLPSPEEAVEKEMRPENIRVEVKEGGKWVAASPAPDPAARM